MKDKSNINSEFDAAYERGASIAGRSLSKILQEIINHLTEIIRSEVRLAKVEVRDDVTQVTRAGVFFLVGAVFAFQALMFVLLGLVFALGSRMPLWLSAGVVGLGAGVIAIIVLRVGRARLKQARLKPEKTIRSLQENLTWMKKQTE